MDAKKRVIQWLFDSQALQVAAAHEPYWYTSGKFGPYYINTHYLYGTKAAAEDLLDDITHVSACPLALPHLISKRCIQQYTASEAYRGLADLALETLRVHEFDLISGGERRDFFFSMILADLFQVEHLSILKDGRSYLSTVGFKQCHEIKPGELAGKKVLHVADLVTEASSYFRAWLPAIAASGASIHDSFAVVDRQQGGREALADRDISLHSLVKIDRAFFAMAAAEGYIDQAQAKQMEDFGKDPDQYMHDFLKEDPQFFKRSIEKDEALRQRIERCQRLGFGQELAKC